MQKRKGKIGTMQMISLGFLITIIIGTILLKLPISNYGNLKMSDAIFIAISSTCVTGFSTVNIIDTFTIFGQTIIILLVQIGGLRIYANHCTYAYDTWQKNNT